MHTLQHHAPTLRPSLFARALYALSKRRYGKTIAPMREIYTHMPPSFAVVQFAALHYFERSLSLPPRLKLLLALFVSRHNRCSFCADLHAYEALRANITHETLNALDDPQSAPHLFSHPERAALRFANTLLTRQHIDPDTPHPLAPHFDTRQRIEITWAVGLMTSLNILSAGSGLTSDQLCPLPPQ